jgi:hypothetical protein
MKTFSKQHQNTFGLTSTLVLLVTMGLLLSIFTIRFAINHWITAQKNVNKQDVAENQQPIASKTIVTLLEDLNQKGLNLDPKFSHSGLTDSLWWVSDDNWSILIKEVSHVSIIRPEVMTELKTKNSYTSQLITETTNFFIKAGFIKSKQNSSRSVDDDSFFDYVLGFQNADEKCAITVNPDEGFYLGKNGQMIPEPNITIACATNDAFQQAYAEQIELLKAVGNRKQIIHIQKITDTAAKVGVNSRRSGAMALLSKQSGHWEVIASGQGGFEDITTCEVMREYAFPKAVFDHDCF